MIALLALPQLCFLTLELARNLSVLKPKLLVAIVKGTLHPHFSEPSFIMQTIPFSVLCDESNKGDKKHFAILVRMSDNTINRPVT